LRDLTLDAETPLSGSAMSPRILRRDTLPPMPKQEGHRARSIERDSKHFRIGMTPLAGRAKSPKSI